MPTRVEKAVRVFRKLTIGLLGCALLPALAYAQGGQLWVGDQSRVTVDPFTNTVVDVKIEVPDGCANAGNLLSLSDFPGNLDVPIIGNSAVGGPSQLTCVPGQRTTFDRFNFNRNTGQLFADFYCQETQNPSAACQQHVIQDALELVGCTPDPTTLCLNDGRFQVQVDFQTPQGASGHGMAVPFTSDDSGAFFFFNPDNYEMLLKVLDSCNQFNRFWVFFAATTNVEFEVTVTDTMTNDFKVYTNLQGHRADAITDTKAFATCP